MPRKALHLTGTKPVPEFKIRLKVELFGTNVGAPRVGARDVIARLTRCTVLNAPGTHKGSPYICLADFNSS